TQAEAVNRLNQYGKNSITKVRKKSIYLRFISNFIHLMAILLWISGGIAFLAGMPELGVAVWMVNVINGIFSFCQEFRAEKAAEALQKLLPVKVMVIRDNQHVEILAENLVPGDLMVLSEGVHISADGRLVEASQMRVDQSTLTGESHPVKKVAESWHDTELSAIEIPNLIFAGTNVVSGTGLAVVAATGMNTEFGKVAHLTQAIEEEMSPLQKEMIHVTRRVSIIAFSVGSLFFLVMAILTPVSPAKSFIFALGIIVAFIPEGLLPTVTLSLARGSQRMAKRHALIKRLSAVETLGCTSVICTDKTGTLTQNEMTVQKIWLSGINYSVSGIGYSPDGKIISDNQDLNPLSVQDLNQFLTAGALCSDARLIPPEHTSAPWTIQGDPTEAALLVVALKGGIKYEDQISKSPQIREYPFDSRRKMMSVIHQVDNKQVIYLKGAPKSVLDICSSFLELHNELSLTDDKRSEIMKVNDSLSEQGLRVLAMAMKTIPGDLKAENPEEVEKDLTFLGLVAMIDPPRPEVIDAVKKCHQAHIRIIMITGDYGLTAKSIARSIGIIEGENPRIITGSDLDQITADELKTALHDEVIFARVAPEHKLRVVETLKELGHIVAVTGDGVNDAPALKKADIGVAMGMTGTDVAKEAADIILTDDNFASIVNAVEEGRTVYANIKKFTGYIFTSNATEAVPFIFFASSKGRIPLALNVMPILSIDLGTDLIPALALGSEPAEPGIMDIPPRNLKEHVITKSLLMRSYLWLAPIQGLAVMSAFFYEFWTNGYWGQIYGLPSDGPLYHSAVGMALAAVVTTQIGNLLGRRTDRSSLLSVGLFTNNMIWIGIASELIIIFSIIYIPFLQNVIGTAPFPLHNWIFLFAWAPVLLIAEELRKTVMRIIERKKDEHKPVEV
ncbi:MAG TPA: cation-transporting P-type ATPase, partial [Methanospirillum sp.]|uniref:cation-translocating P-type ATPase n=1 Tax=Methanospirillum sp. TaxID=45200 RepID=UPI002B6D8A87